MKRKNCIRWGKRKEREEEKKFMCMDFESKKLKKKKFIFTRKKNSENRKKDYLDLFLSCLQKDFKYNVYIVPYLILTNTKCKFIVVKILFVFKGENAKQMSER